MPNEQRSQIERPKDKLNGAAKIKKKQKQTVGHSPF